MAARKAVGIVTRHTRTCSSREGRRCTCTPSFQAWVNSPRDGRKLRKTFRSLAEARNWRRDALHAIGRGALRAATSTTLTEVAEAWLDGARSGAIRTRSGDAFKPSTLRGYQQALKTRVLPELGGAKLR